MVICTISLTSLLAFTGFLTWNSYGNVVFLKNASHKPLSNIIIKFSGGESRLETLPINADRVLIVNVRGESGLSVLFTDEYGARHEGRLNVYLEPGYKGHIDVSISPQYNLIWKDFVFPFPTF
jgi:hypothetical protein